MRLRPGSRSGPRWGSLQRFPSLAGIKGFTCKGRWKRGIEKGEGRQMGKRGKRRSRGGMPRLFRRVKGPAHTYQCDQFALIFLGVLIVFTTSSFEFQPWINRQRRVAASLHDLSPLDYQVWGQSIFFLYTIYERALDQLSMLSHKQKQNTEKINVHVLIIKSKQAAATIRADEQPTIRADGQTDRRTDTHSITVHGYAHIQARRHTACRGRQHT